MIYNPFNIQGLKDEALVEHIKDLVDEYDDNADTTVALSDNVMLLSDVLYIYGELLARVQKQYSLAKYENGITETKIAYQLKSETAEKYPMAYFNAMAQEQNLDARREEFELQKKQTELKYAYDATEEKINAIKKKIDSIKYESQF